MDGTINAVETTGVRPMADLTLDRCPVEDGVLRIAVGGEIDIATSQVLGEAISTAIKAWSVAELVVDLGEATFLDSTGISVLVAGYNLAADYGVAYTVINAHDLVRRTLDITGVLTTLTEQA